MGREKRDRERGEERRRKGDDGGREGGLVMMEGGKGNDTLTDIQHSIGQVINSTRSRVLSRCIEVSPILPHNMCKPTTNVILVLVFKPRKLQLLNKCPYHYHGGYQTVKFLDIIFGI